MSGIEKIWNPIMGCAGRISAGCLNCQVFYKLRKHEYGGDPCINEGDLTIPSELEEESMLWVSQLGDFFTDLIPHSQRDRIFDVIQSESGRRHTYLIETKYVVNMFEYFSLRQDRFMPFPSNVWVGVSGSTPKNIQRRVKYLARIPASIRFLSIFPMFQYIDVTPYLDVLDLIRVGGETGKITRDFDTAWALQIRDACQHADTVFYFIGVGSGHNTKVRNRKYLRGMIYQDYPLIQHDERRWEEQHEYTSA